MDRLSEKQSFTIKEASDLGLGSVRLIRYMIKEQRIQCIPPWNEENKWQRRVIPRDELVRLGVLRPLAEVSSNLNAEQVLKLKDVDEHLEKIWELKQRLELELWLPPLHYLPARDLSIHYDAYSERIIYWTDSEDGLPIIELPVEGEVNFKYLSQHTEDSELWRHLMEWKQLGGHYVLERFILLDNIKKDIQTETELPTVAKDTKNDIFEGFSWIIFRSLFPQVHPERRKIKQLVEKAISLAGEGCWSEAVEVNRDIIKMFPGDVNALKRLGKAQMELQRYVSAKEAYSRVLEIDQCDAIAQKMLMELLHKCPDDSGIARVDGGRYRVVSKQPSLWLLAVFADDEGENIASVCPTEIGLIITAFQNLLAKYRTSSKIEAILELRRKIDQLERSLLQESKAITLGVLANSKCDGCPL